VRAELTAQDRQGRSVFVVRVRRNAHHYPRILKIEQRLIKLNLIAFKSARGREPWA